MPAPVATWESSLLTKDDLLAFEQRVIAHLDARITARLARNKRVTIAWVTAMNATMLGAVIAAIRL